MVVYLFREYPTHLWRNETIITDIQKKWLEEILSGKLSKSDNPRKYSAYMGRIQERIDNMIENLVWLADNAPDILKYEEREYDSPTTERHLRLKKFLRVCTKISPYSDDPTLFKILSEIIPNFNIELTRKRGIPSPLKVLRCKRCKATFEAENYKEKGNKCPFCGFEKVEETI